MIWHIFVKHQYFQLAFCGIISLAWSVQAGVIDSAASLKTTNAWLYTFITFCVVIVVFSFLAAPFNLDREREITYDQLNLKFQSTYSTGTKITTKIEIPNPNIVIQKRTLNAWIGGNQNVLIATDESKDINVTAFGLEFRFKPSVDVSGSVVLEASVQINGKPFEKGSWLHAFDTHATLGIGESDHLVLAVKQAGELFQYKLGKRSTGVMGNTMTFGQLVPLINDTSIEVEYVCTRHGKVIDTQTAKMRLFVADEVTFFDFTTDSPIKHDYPLLEPKT